MLYPRLATPLIASVESVGKPRFDNGPISETIREAGDRNFAKAATEREKRVVGLGKQSQQVATGCRPVAGFIADQERTADFAVFLQTRYAHSSLT